MTEQTQIDPPWKAALRASVFDAVNEAWENYESLGEHSGTPTTDAVLAAVLPHMETSYRTGRMAGASTAAKRLAQKNLEQARKLREIRNVALLGGFGDVLSIVDEES